MPYPPPITSLPVLSSLRPGEGNPTFYRQSNTYAQYLPCYVRHCTEMCFANAYADYALFAPQGCPNLHF